MLYHLYELNQAALSPARAAAEAYRLLFRNPLNPASHTPLGRGAAAALELFERTTRRYRKPAWDIPLARRRKDSKFLIVAPMAGHFPTLLRGTVRDMLPHHEVYVTEWRETRRVPRAAFPAIR